MTESKLKILLGFSLTYGSLGLLGYLTSWWISLLLLLMMMGHNLDKH